jgi:hypothetical protein
MSEHGHSTGDYREDVERQTRAIWKFMAASDECLWEIEATGITLFPPVETRLMAVRAKIERCVEMQGNPKL